MIRRVGKVLRLERDATVWTVRHPSLPGAPRTEPIARVDVQPRLGRMYLERATARWVAKPRTDVARKPLAERPSVLWPRPAHEGVVAGTIKHGPKAV